MKTDPALYEAWYATPFGALCHRLERDALFSLAEFRPGELVLDAGCGTGVYLEELSRMGSAAVGVDDDEEMLRYAALHRGLGRVLIKASMLSLPFEASSFEKAVSVCALEFLDDPLPALKELNRVLKKDGVLLLGFLNSGCAWARERSERGRDASSIWHGVRFFSLQDISGLAFRAGLLMRGFEGAVYFPPDARDKDVEYLEVIEAAGRRSSPMGAAFFGAAFVKTRECVASG